MRNFVLFLALLTVSPLSAQAEELLNLYGSQREAYLSEYEDRAARYDAEAQIHLEDLYSTQGMRDVPLIDRKLSEMSERSPGLSENIMQNHDILTNPPNP